MVSQGCRTGLRYGADNLSLDTRWRWRSAGHYGRDEVVSKRPPTRVTCRPSTALAPDTAMVKASRRTMQPRWVGIAKPPMGGYLPAQYALGSGYANGRGVPRDDVEAVRWYRKAAYRRLPCRPNTASASCTPMAVASPATMPKRCGGIARLPNRVTLRRCSRHHPPLPRYSLQVSAPTVGTATPDQRAAQQTKPGRVHPA